MSQELKMRWSADDSSRVNCALEKTNQNLSDEICRLKVHTKPAEISFRMLFIVHGDFERVSLWAAASHALLQEEIDADKKKLAQLQKQVRALRTGYTYAAHFIR